MQHSFSPSSSRALSICLSVLVLGLLVGCDSLPGFDDSGPSSYPLEDYDSTTLGPGITVAVRTPDSVALGDEFPLRIRVDNQTSRAVTVTTGNAALWKFGIYDGDEQVPVKGSMLSYATVVTCHEIAPGTTTSTVDLRAVRSSDAEPPLSPGTYTARVEMDWRIDGAAVTDTLETTVVFVEE